MTLFPRFALLIAAANVRSALLVGGAAVSVLVLLLMLAVIARYGRLWLAANLSNADVSGVSLVMMTCRRIDANVIVQAKIMAAQSGLDIERRRGLSTASLQAHYLAGGDVLRVVGAVIVAQRADIEMDFARAAAIDLAGRDIRDAIRTSVSPRVIECPDPQRGRRLLSAMAKNGIELRIRALVTVRTNLDQLIGGAAEETIIARVGQGIISAIGSAKVHTDVLASPDWISKRVLQDGLGLDTVFEIVSIDVSQIEVGTNIGATLQIEQADADLRMARAAAEVRRANAVAKQRAMRAKVAENYASLVQAEAGIPEQIASAFRARQHHASSSNSSTTRSRSAAPSEPCWLSWSTPSTTPVRATDAWGVDASSSK